MQGLQDILNPKEANMSTPGDKGLITRNPSGEGIPSRTMPDGSVRQANMSGPGGTRIVTPGAPMANPAEGVKGVDWVKKAKALNGIRSGMDMMNKQQTTGGGGVTSSGGQVTQGRQMHAMKSNQAPSIAPRQSLGSLLYGKR
jgi:hypothetical protein